MEFNSTEELLAYSKKIIGNWVSDYNVKQYSLAKNNKGVIGRVVEEGFFGYKANNIAKADFEGLGVELKVTGLIQRKKKDFISIKERLVLNMINYFKEYGSDFESSSFWKKNNHLLIIFYLYEKKDDFDFQFIESFLHKFSPEDLYIIKQDWNYINEKISAGKAHELSEGDTMYLGATPKGADAESSWGAQPGSNILAKGRAFSLKPSYMNRIIKQQLIGEKVHSLLDIREIKESSFEIVIKSKLNKYIGYSVSKLINVLNIRTNTKAKSILSTIVNQLLDSKSNINNSDEFTKAGIKLKTIRINEKNSIDENMSFPTFKFKEIIDENWDNNESETKELFTNSKFLFVIFKYKDNDYYLHKVLFWNMPVKDIDDFVKPVWKSLKETLLSGNIIEKIDGSGRYITNFPHSSFNSVCHIRPHDAKSYAVSKKGFELPVPDKLTGFRSYTKSCFWLDRKYILKIVSNN
jgi:DNA mismatch repair protein MutH